MACDTEEPEVEVGPGYRQLPGGEPVVKPRRGLAGLLQPFYNVEPDHVTCLGLCCARLSCSWCAKLCLLLGILQACFLWGSLSRPLWIPISKDRACQRCKDAGGCPKAISHKPHLPGGRKACESLCETVDGCQAVDWFRHSGWCTLYAEACSSPDAAWDEASSFQIAVGCDLHNGSSGVLIAGHCHTGIQLPSTWSIAQEEVPDMLLSPFSWACSFIVALLYTYLMSPWFRGAAKPVVAPLAVPFRRLASWLRRGGCWRRAAAVALLLAAWWAFTVWEWGPSPVPKSLPEAEKLPLSQLAWLCGSAFVLLLAICPMCRSAILAVLLTVVGWIMSLFTSLAACAFSACFDSAAAGLALLSAGGTAALAADGAAAGAVAADGVGAAEGLGAVEAGAGAEGAVADGAAMGGAAAEATAGAEAAVASEAAAAAAASAEAAAAAEGAAAAVVLCTLL